MIKIIMKVNDIKEGTEIYKIRGETPYILRRTITIGKQVITADKTNNIQDALLINKNTGDAYAISGDKELVVYFSSVNDFLDYIDFEG